MAAKIVTGLALTLLASQTSAGSLHPLNGKELLKLCQDNELTTKSLCQGYILGASDAGDACIPPEIRTETLTNLVVSSLNTSIGDNAAMANSNAAMLVQQRIGTVFPCTNAQADEPDPKQNWSNKKRIGK